ETLQPGVVAGDQFICVADSGRLISHDLKKGTRRHLGVGGARDLLGSIDVAEGRACVASRENVYVIELASGKILHTLRHADGPVSVGFAESQHVYAASPRAVEVFDLKTGKLQHSIELSKAESKPSDPKAGNAKAVTPGDQTEKPASSSEKRPKRGAD